MTSVVVQILAASITGVAGIFVALFTRRGSREQNEVARVVRIDTASDKLIENLQEDNKDIRAEIKELKDTNKNLDFRVKSLERSRYAWKYWAQRIVPILEGLGAKFPPTPEKLEDTDPSMRGTT